MAIPSGRRSCASVSGAGVAVGSGVPTRVTAVATTDAASAAQAIRTFIDARAPRPEPRARTMAQHFDELFALYEACAEGRAAA